MFTQQRLWFHEWTNALHYLVVALITSSSLSRSARVLISLLHFYGFFTGINYACGFHVHRHGYWCDVGPVRRAVTLFFFFFSADETVLTDKESCKQSRSSVSRRSLFLNPGWEVSHHSSGAGHGLSRINGLWCGKAGRLSAASKLSRQQHLHLHICLAEEMWRIFTNFGRKHFNKPIKSS